MEKVQDDAMNWWSLLMDGTVPYTAAIQSLNISSSEGGKRLYGQNVAIIVMFTPFT